MIYTLLLLLSIFILQRIDFLFTSIGFLVLSGLFIYSVFLILIKKNLLNFNKKSILYLIFILSFIYNIPFFLNDINITKVLVVLAPLLIWLLLSVFNNAELKFIFNRKILYIILIILGVILLYDFYTMFTSSNIIKKVYNFANPNYTALLILILEVLYLFTNKIYDNKKYLFFIFASILIVFTLSKTAYIMQILLLLLLVNRKVIVNIFFFGLISSIFGLVYFQNTEIELIESISYFFERSSGSAITHRLHLMNAALNIFNDHLIFGCGHTLYQEIAFTQYNSGLNVKTHNIILTLLSENGIVGFTLFLISVFLLVIYIIKYKHFKKEKTILLLIFFAYALSHAGSQFFTFVPLLFYIVQSNIYKTLGEVNAK